MKNNQTIQRLASMVALAGMVVSVAATAKVGGVPRGPDISPSAAGCNIGKFPQTTKAGGYNVLCNIMSDSEKCFAYLKGHFEYDGSIQKAGDSDKMQYCLETLAKDLGVKSPL